MKKLQLALELLFRRPSQENEDGAIAWERMAKEIKGSIFTLITLFEFVALTSYIPIDSFNIFQGRLDRMHNLGGLVGALFGEWFLGTVGIAGYFIVVLTGWLAICAFKGIPLKENISQIIGAILGAILTAISCYLLFNERFPEASLFQGGMVGKTLGTALMHYLNTAGSLLVVGGGFIVTLILTTGLSFARISRALLESGENKEEQSAEENAPAPPVRKTKPVSVVAAKKSVKRKKPKKEKIKNPDGLEELDEENDGKDDDESLEENSEDDESASQPTEFTFEELIPFTGKYESPSLRLLKSVSNGAKKMSRGELKEASRKLCEHLLSFQITGEVVQISQGPVLTTYEFKPSAGIKLSRIAALQDDLGVILGTRELRIVAPIPGKTVVGIEVPRPHAEIISLKDVLNERQFHDKKMKIPFTLGKATDGTPIFSDLTALPHLLVAGATGSGKSVFINSLIMSFLFRLSPQELRLILIDPKMLELTAFEGIPHLVTPVITNNDIAYNALNWAVMEMERRYNLMAETGSKNIDSYNAKMRGTQKLPYIVIVVDELADLMLSGGEAVEVAITRLAQKARAAGIHLVIATQRPSTDVITGLIKANIPSRLSFKVPSGVDSRTILDASGAEELIGRGDSLMIRPAVPIQRLHGCFVTEEELLRVAKSVKGHRNFSDYYIDFQGKP